MAALGVFGASQLAGVIPGPERSQPARGRAGGGVGRPRCALDRGRAVALKAPLAWLPALVLGGGSFSLVFCRRALRLHGSGASVPAS